MKKLIICLALVLTASTASAITTLGFRNISTATGDTNATASCTVLSGTVNADGTFVASGITTYGITSKAGVSSTVTLSSGQDYKITCFSTASPLTAKVVKMFFDGSETNYFPMSTFLLRFK